jgi:pyruvate,water dikinase
VPDGGDDDTVWSRIPIGDGVLDVPTPLSASLYEAFTSVAARPTSALFGARTPRGAVVLGEVNGCLYLNESLLETIARRGVAQDARVIADFAGSAADVGDPSLLALSVAFTRVLALEQSLALEAGQVERDADAHARWLSEMDLGILPDDGLTTTLLEARHHLFTAWQLRIAAMGALAAVSHAAQRLLERRIGADAQRLARLLGDPSSEFPTSDFARAWHHVAAIVASEPSARQAVVDGATATTALRDGPSRRALTSFLSAYADHGPCTEELALARWREDERTLFALLRSAVVGSLVDLDVTLAHGRSALAQDLDAALARLSFFERRMLHAALPRLRRLAVLADRAHRLSVRAAGALRVVLVDADRRLLRGEPTLDVGTAFLLGFDELCALLNGPTHALGILARQRRASWHRQSSRPRPPARFSGDAVQELPSVVEPLRGIGSGRGVASGRARRVIPWHPATIGGVEPGDVVVAESLDPSLLPLLFTAAAVVVARGSAWAAGLPFARELGVPVVVAVGDGLERYDDGTPLEVDAVAGVVHRR